MERDVPTYRYGQDGSTPERVEFLRRWFKAWQAGNALDIQGQYQYLFDYMFYCIYHRTPTEIIQQLTALREAYPAIDRTSRAFHMHALEYTADSHVILDNIEKAIETFSGGYRLFIQIPRNKLFSLRAFNNEDITGMDVLFFRGAPRVTTWGMDNVNAIAKVIDSVLIERLNREPNRRIIDRWIEHTKAIWTDYPHPPSPWYQAYRGQLTVKIPYYSFRVPKDDYATIAEIWREAENLARVTKGLPKIGEGWISETELYYEIKEALSDLKVVHHASPPWLGRQHLDIYIPSLEVAIEYQGRQHYEPIEHFGGEEAFAKTQKRDARKGALCEKHGITLIWVRKGYNLDDVIAEIRQG